MNKVFVVVLLIVSIVGAFYGQHEMLKSDKKVERLSAEEVRRSRRALIEAPSDAETMFCRALIEMEPHWVAVNNILDPQQADIRKSEISGMEGFKSLKIQVKNNQLYMVGTGKLYEDFMYPPGHPAKIKMPVEFVQKYLESVKPDNADLKDFVLPKEK